MSHTPRPVNPFVVLYCGDTIASASLVAASTDPELVELAVSKMLEDIQDSAQDNVGAAISEGRRQALDLLNKKGEH